MAGTQTATSGRHLGECAPLLALATPDLYRNNLFRVLGVRINASVREVGRLEQRQRMQAKLGIAGPATVPSGVWEASSVQQERRLAQELMGRPVDRVVHELFWFWPESSEAPALSALAAGSLEEPVRIWEALSRGSRPGVGLHNLAVLRHVQALDWERSPEAKTDPARRGEVWSRAFEGWYNVHSSDDFWDLFRERFRELDDAQLTPGLVRSIRRTLPLALVSVNAILAYETASAGEATGARELLSVARESGFDPSMVDQAVRGVLSPIRDRIRAATDRARREWTATPRTGSRIVRELLDQAAQPLALVDAMLPDGDMSRTELHDGLAEAMLEGLVAFGNHTEDWTESGTVLELVLGVAAGDTVRTRVSSNRDIVRTNTDDGFYWCAPGYWDLPEDAIEALEAARAKVGLEDYDGAIADLVVMDPTLGHPLRRALAFAVNGRAVGKANSAQREHDGSAVGRSRLGRIVGDALSGVILASEIDPDAKTVADNRKELEKLAEELGVRVPTSADLRRTLAGDRTRGTPVQIAAGTAEATCHFCGENPGEIDAAVSVPLYGALRRVELLLGDGTTYEHGSVFVPRCSRCRTEHAALAERTEGWAKARQDASQPERFPELVAEVATTREEERRVHSALAQARAKSAEANEKVKLSAELRSKCDRCGSSDAWHQGVCLDCESEAQALGSDWNWVLAVGSVAGFMASFFGWGFGVFKSAIAGGTLAFAELKFGRHRRLEGLRAARMPALVKERLIAVEEARREASAVNRLVEQRRVEYEDGAVPVLDSAKKRLTDARVQAFEAFEAGQPLPALPSGIAGEESFADFSSIGDQMQLGWSYGNGPLDESSAAVDERPREVLGLVGQPVELRSRLASTECPNCARDFDVEDDMEAYRFECECGTTFDYWNGTTEAVGKVLPQAKGTKLRVEAVAAAQAAAPEDLIPCPVCSAQTKAKNLVRHFDRLHRTPLRSDESEHTFDSRGICTDCGCSRGAIDRFGFSCSDQNRIVT